jgi:hypothetical protein
MINWQQMPSSFTTGLRRFVLWDYPRASWQYDVMVAIILAFIFLMPRDLFRDQPRIPRASNIAMLPAEHGSELFWIDPELLSGIPESQRISRLGQILKTRTGRNQTVLRVQPIYDDSENELKGYMAFTKP